MENVKNVRKIDIHAHATAFPQYYPPFWGKEKFISAEETIAFYDQLGIEKGVLMPLVAAEGKATPSTTEECKYIVNKHPVRFILFATWIRATLNIQRVLLTSFQTASSLVATLQQLKILIRLRLQQHLISCLMTA